MNIYKENGYENRRDYLESLCEEYDRDTVYSLASILGSSEDFDGLITSLEDEADSIAYAENAAEDAANRRLSSDHYSSW
jgi:hypothetical protein